MRRSSSICPSICPMPTVNSTSSLAVAERQLDALCHRTFAKSLKVIKIVSFQSLGMVFYSHSIVTMAMFCFISETGLKRVTGWKSRIFKKNLHSTPPLLGSPLVYWIPCWCGKTRIVWLPKSEISLMICLAFSTEYRRVTERRTDGRTDRWTSCDSVVRAVHSIAR